MSGNLKSEYSFELETKDLITSIDTKENLILLSSFNKCLYFYEIEKNSKTADGKLLRKLEFDYPILHSKFLSLEDRLFVTFCGINYKLEKDFNALFLFELKNLEFLNKEISDLKFNNIIDFKSIITKYTLFQMSLGIVNNKIQDFLLAEDQDLQNYYLYELDKNNIINNLLNIVNDNSEISIILSDQINLQFLSHSHFTILEKTGIMVLAGIENIENEIEKNIKSNEVIENEMENSDFNNIIMIFDLGEKRFELLKKLNSPLNQITNSLNNLNNNGFIIGSLYGRIAVFSNLILENNDKNELQLKYSEFSYKAHKITKDDNNYFFPINCLAYSKK